MLSPQAQKPDQQNVTRKSPERLSHTIELTFSSKLCCFVVFPTKAHRKKKTTLSLESDWLYVHRNTNTHKVC